MTDKVITDELAERVERLLGEFSRAPFAHHLDGTGRAQMFARMAREHGVALVDPNRDRFLVDETVHAGALFRLHEAEAALAADRLPAKLPEVGDVVATPDGWGTIVSSASMMPLVTREPDDLNGEYVE